MMKPKRSRGLGTGRNESNDFTGKKVIRMGSKKKYVMTYKMKDGSAAPSGGVIKTDSKGKPIKRDDSKKSGK